VIRSGAVVQQCILDKEIEIGPEARVGWGNDVTPNQLEPANINTGITIVGKRARIPGNACIGRNCRIDPNTSTEDYNQLEVPSGGTISLREEGQPAE
jgi:glucose-1-phosphate adenylyltransferase